MISSGTFGGFERARLLAVPQALKVDGGFSPRGARHEYPQPKQKLSSWAERSEAEGSAVASFLPANDYRGGSLMLNSETEAGAPHLAFEMWVLSHLIHSEWGFSPRGNA